MAAAIDPHLAWLDSMEFGTSMMSPLQAQYDEQAARAASAIGSRYASPGMSYSGVTTPEPKRHGVWDASQSPVRPTSSSFHQVAIPWTLYATTTPSDTFSGTQHVSAGPSAHPQPSKVRMQRGASQSQMPPPPPPPSAYGRPRASESTSAAQEVKLPNAQTEHSAFHTYKQAPQSRLPPQFRDLYNASTVGPPQYVDHVRTWLYTQPVPEATARRFVCSKHVIRKIAAQLKERDVLSLALTCTPVYCALDRKWWTQAFPQNPCNPPTTSAWAYLWPVTHGQCCFCHLWSRIVLHEPSKAQICLDCMQLPTFRVIKFSTAKAIYELDSREAQACIGLLPCVQDNRACYYWVCHLEWIEAHCRLEQSKQEAGKAEKTAKDLNPKAKAPRARKGAAKPRAPRKTGDRKAAPLKSNGSANITTSSDHGKSEDGEPQETRPSGRVRITLRKMKASTPRQRRSDAHSRQLDAHPLQLDDESGSVFGPPSQSNAQGVLATEAGRSDGRLLKPTHALSSGETSFTSTLGKRKESTDDSEYMPPKSQCRQRSQSGAQDFATDAVRNISRLVIRRRAQSSSLQLVDRDREDSDIQTVRATESCSKYHDDDSAATHGRQTVLPLLNSNVQRCFEQDGVEGNGDGHTEGVL